MNDLNTIATGITAIILLTFVDSQSLYHRKIECYSFGEGYFNECPILDKSSYSVDLIRTLENSESCDLGVSYGVIRLQYIWVDKGCKAEFLIKAYGFGGYIDSDAAETSHNKVQVASAPEFDEPPLAKPKAIQINSARRRTQWFPSASSMQSYHYGRQAEYPYGGMRAYPYGEEDVTMSSNDVDVNEINADQSGQSSDTLQESGHRRTIINHGTTRELSQIPKLGRGGSKVIKDPLYKLFHRMKQQGIYQGSNQHINSTAHQRASRGDRKSKKRVLPDNFAYELNPKSVKDVHGTKLPGHELIPKVIDVGKYIPTIGQENRNWNPKVIDYESHSDKHYQPKFSNLNINKKYESQKVSKVQDKNSNLNQANKPSQNQTPRPIINFLCPSSASHFDDIESRNLQSIVKCGLQSSRVRGKKIGLLLVKQQTTISAPCVYGKSYGVTKDRLDVWVTDGCKAWFQILY